MPSKSRILVADDEPYLVRSLTFVLNKEGYDTSVARDGEEALERIREAKPDLMFLDIMMPKKDGYQVCQEVKSDPDLKDIYIIMLTAKGQQADRERALSAGADEFITKPFSPLEILARVKALLG